MLRARVRAWMVKVRARVKVRSGLVFGMRVRVEGVRLRIPLAFPASFLAPVLPSFLSSFLEVRNQKSYQKQQEKHQRSTPTLSKASPRILHPAPHGSACSKSWALNSKPLYTQIVGRPFQYLNPGSLTKL